MQKREIVMGSRLLFRAIAILLLLTGLALESGAAETTKSSRHRILLRHPPVRMCGGYYGRIGGHRCGEASRSYVHQFPNDSAYNYPGYLNNQYFWERVETQANYPIRY
jgi:hypothetical protein